MGIRQHLSRKIRNFAAKVHNTTETPKITEDRSELFRLDLTKAHRKRWGDSWYRAGVIVTNAEGEFLLVEDLRRRINGVWQDVTDTWNIPSGSCEEDERFVDAAVREAHEELGQGVRLKGICAIKHGKHNDDPCLLIVFVAELTGEVFTFDRQEVKSQRWFSEAAIYNLARQDKLRSADLVLQAVENYRKGFVLPLEVLNEYSPAP